MSSYAQEALIYDEAKKEKEEKENKQQEAEVDMVNNPSHYCREGAMECIDEMLMFFGVREVMSFCKLNAWKYRERAIFKNGIEDIKKSDWYINKYRELEKSLVDSLKTGKLTCVN